MSVPTDATPEQNDEADASAAVQGDGPAAAQSNPRPAPFTSRRVQVAGLSLHYLDYGGEGKPPMVCVHGGAAHAHWFDFVAGAFVDRYHVISLDQRGHGESQWAIPTDYSYEAYASDLAEFIRALGLNDVTLVGHSMGGMISLLCTASYTTHVGRLVVIDTTMRMTPDRVANLRQVGSRKGRVHADRDSFMAHYRLRPAGTRADESIIRHLAGYSARQFDDGSWGHKFDRNVYATREPIDGMLSWAKISVPALIIAGGESGRITAEISREVRTRCAHVAMQTVPHADHHVTLDNPVGFTHALHEFLDQA